MSEPSKSIHNWKPSDIARYLTSHERRVLRAGLAGLVAEACACNPRIRATTRDARAAWRGTKAAYGAHARYLHLAHGLLRGVPYAALEASTRPGNAPSPERLRAVVDLFGDWWARTCWTPEAIKAWLAVPATPEQVAAQERARVAAQEAREARHVRRLARAA